jgi:phosphoribosylformylglycinamidine synthase
MTFRATIRVTLRPSILDPQGKAALHALGELGYAGIEDVRIGKYIEMRIDAADASAAGALVEAACEKLLANPVMEDFAFEVVALAEEVQG